jgi:hypothetical protein
MQTGVCVECAANRKEDPVCSAMTGGERPRCHVSRALLLAQCADWLHSLSMLVGILSPC